MNNIINLKKFEWDQILDKIKKQKLSEVSFLNLTITQDEARQILQGNENNRHINEDLINKYTLMMNKGKWVLNGETIKIATDGRLLDGQHRMHAISAANLPVKMSFAFGLDHKHFETIDTGRTRTAGDILKIAGYKNVHTLASTGRLMLTYQKGDSFNFLPTLTPENILEAIKRWPKLTSLVRNATELKTILPGSIALFFIYVTRHIDEDKSFDFFYKLQTGEKLTKTSSILLLRNLLIKYKSSQTQLDKRYCMAYLINAWNAYYTGNRVKNIKWQSGQSFPEIIGVNKKKLFLRNSLKAD